LLVGELAIHGRKGVRAALDVGLVLGVEINLEDPLSVDLDAGPLPHDLRRIADVVEDGIVDRRQRPGSGAGSLRLLTAIVRLPQDIALGNDEDVPAGKLLLKFPDEPLMNLVERLPKLVWDVQQDRFPAATAVDLFRRSDVQIPERRFQIGGCHLQVEQLLRHGGFEFVRLGLHKFEIEGKRSERNRWGCNLNTHEVPLMINILHWKWPTRFASTRCWH